MKYVYIEKLLHLKGSLDSNSCTACAKSLKYWQSNLRYHFSLCERVCLCNINDIFSVLKIYRLCNCNKNNSSEKQIKKHHTPNIQDRRTQPLK